MPELISQTPPNHTKDQQGPDHLAKVTPKTKP